MEPRYEFIRKIGSGGMAEVFHARLSGQEGFRREVAIKRLYPWLTSDPRALDMFVDEARILSGLAHPNIVQVIDFKRFDDEYLLIMEYVNGTSLARLLGDCRRANTPLSHSLVAHIAAETARGLAYAHSKTDPAGKPLFIVHRDVSPDNVLISTDGQVKVVDFGIAKAADRTAQTAIGRVKGKLQYMAPERLRSAAADARCDQFSLGLVVWEMVFCERLFDGTNEQAIFFQIGTFKGPDLLT